MLSLVLLGATLAAAQQAPGEILDQAIARAGGREAMRTHPVLEWRASATIHVPGRVIEIAGEWDVRPDSAVSATWLKDQPNAPRRLILSSAGGWTQRGDAAPAPMPPELLLEERHQFYLYQVLRLVPLLDPAFSLQAAPPDSQGHAGIRVTHPDHPDVTLYFDQESRVAALHTVFAAPDMSNPEPQHIELTGEVESHGVRWFRNMKILRAGQPYFDMTITDFRAQARR
jgi:hypothetical protein